MLETNISLNIADHVGPTPQHLLFQIELKLQEKQHGQILILLPKFLSHVVEMMDVMEVKLTMLLNGCLKMKSLMKLALSIEPEVMIMVKNVLL